jgi:diguanylate cyclase (GGDEF)-like protein/PAS domain S-box-containing protein
MNITQRFALAMLLIGVLPLLAAGVLSYTTARDALRDEVLSQQQELLASYEDQLALVLDQVESLVANIAGVEAITDAVRQPPGAVTNYQRLATQARVGYILNGYLNVKGLVSIHVFGATGAHYQVGDTLSTRQTPGMRERIEAALEQNDSWVVWPGLMHNINANSPQRHVVPAAKALYTFDPDRLERRRIGVVIVNFSAEHLSEQLQDRTGDSGRQVFLIDHHGRYVAHPDPAAIGEQADDCLCGPFAGDAGSPVRLDGVDYYLSREPVDRLDWTLLSAIPRARVQNAIAGIGSTSVVVFTLALLFVAATAFYFSRKVVLPIRHVTDAFRRLRNAETGIDKLQTRGNDEVAELARGFNLFVDEMAGRQASEEALKISEERYELVARATDEGIWDYDRGSGVFYLSPRLRQIIGLDDDGNDMARLSYHRMVHADDRRQFARELKRFLRPGGGDSRSFEHRILHADGSIVYVRNNCQAVRDASGRVMRLVGSLQDITAQKQIEYRLRHDASHDPLTGLYNRAWMIKRIERELAASGDGNAGAFAVLFVDLDDFKTINDTLGHSYGDLLLVEVAQRMEACLRPGDALARLGGDEFILLLIGIGNDDAIGVVERLVTEIGLPCRLRGNEYRTRASIGVAFSSAGYRHAEEILRDADTAMYRAKLLGKGRYVIFDRPMRESLLQRATIEQELAKALERNQLEMHYQPIVDLRRGVLSGFEALLRWNHPRRQMSPAEFIPAAEESAQIHELGDWTMRTVLEQVARWEREFRLDDRFRVAINISPRQFHDTLLIDRFARHIEETGVDPAHLTIELTETAIFRDRTIVMGDLQRLRAMHVGISLDDFGTGYSSLSFLNTFPIDAIKIDQSFVMGMAAGTREAQLVDTLILMGRELGIKVIAEGVERADLLKHLRERGCDYAQGFFLGRPMPAAQATAMLLDSGVEGGWFQDDAWPAQRADR